MSLDVCAFQCQRSARSKCRHPELKMTFLKQLVNSDCQSFLNLFFFFPCLLQKTGSLSLLLAKSHSRMGQAVTTQLTPRGKSIYWKPLCILAIVIRNLQSCKSTKGKKKKKANSLLQGSSSLAQKRQNKRSKVTQKHEE